MKACHLVSHRHRCEYEVILAIFIVLREFALCNNHVLFSSNRLFIWAHVPNFVLQFFWFSVHTVSSSDTENEKTVLSLVVIHGFTIIRRPFDICQKRPPHPAQIHPSALHPETQESILAFFAKQIFFALWVYYSGYCSKHLHQFPNCFSKCPNAVFEKPL